MVPPILLETYVVISLSFHRVAWGIILAHSTILTAAITGKITDIEASADEASTITMMFSLTGIIGYFILPVIMQKYGRKVINIVMNLIFVVGSIVIATASNVPALIAGRSIQGLGSCSFVINTILSGEYTHPKRRGVSINLLGLALQFGIIVCHILSLTMSWRGITWVGAVFAAMGAISTVFWPESPSWLAYKGRYDDCIKHFELLRGTDLESRSEIEELVSVQQEYRRTRSNEGNMFLNIINTFRCIEFLKPLTIMILITSLAHVSGVYYMLAYIIQIMEKLANDERIVFHYVLGMDAFKIIAVVISSVIVKLFERRTILFYLGSLSFVMLGLLCLTDLLESMELLSVGWLTPTLLIIYCFTSEIGIFEPYAVFIAEIFPLEYKAIGSSAMGITYCALGIITLKYTPTMLISLMVYGTFGLYLSMAVVCLICLKLLLPETKDKTLQSIEMNFINLKKDKGDSDVAQKMLSRERTQEK